MKKLTTADAVYGPYTELDQVEGGYLADGSLLPFSVVGEGVIEDWGGELPPSPAELRRIEKQWAGVRAERNRKLAACDWTQLPDSPLTNTQQLEWATYRQALRDITLQSDPFSIVWPEEPAA